jgi:hypothetical protein
MLLAALAAPAAAQEDIRIVTLRSPAFQGERKLIVRTPAAYPRRPDARFPVLYYTDGAGNTDALAATVRFLEGQDRIPPLVLVGLVHDDRGRELTPSHDPDAPTSGGADVLLAFLEREVVPWVERTYRAGPLRILAGHSLGGLFSLHVLASRPGMFRAHVAISPTLSWDSGLPLRRLEELVGKRPDARAILVVARGDEGPELARDLERLRAILARAPGVELHAHAFPGESHGSVIFLADYQALLDVFAGYAMPVAAGDVGPRGGIEAVDAHYRALSERLGTDPTPPEGVLNMAAYQLLRDGDLLAARSAFERVVERYPASANAHDSLGEAFERSGDIAGACREYGVAVELATRARDPGVRAYERNLDRARAQRGPSGPPLPGGGP